MSRVEDVLTLIDDVLAVEVPRLEELAEIAASVGELSMSSQSWSGRPAIAAMACRS